MIGHLATNLGGSNVDITTLISLRADSSLGNPKLKNLIRLSVADLDDFKGITFRR